MADTPAPAKAGGKSSFGFLTRKLGFMPVWGWGLAAFGGYYWYTHFGPGKKASGQTVTDPAGNTCSALAPSGYCPGTPEDLAAQQTQTMPAGSSDGSPSDGSLPVPPMPPVPGPPPPGPTGPPVKPPPRKRPPPSPPPRLIGPPARVPPRPPPRRVPPGPTGPPVIAPGPRPAPRPAPGPVPIPVLGRPPAPEPRPVPVVAPGTSGAVYGGVPVSRIDGSTYDPGAAAAEGGAYVPAL